MGRPEMKWDSDQELLAWMRARLYSAVLGDAMDRAGLQHQFLPPQIKPLRPDMVLAGRAMPVLEADISPETPDDSPDPMLSQPFGRMFAALDDLKPGDVYVCTGASLSYALWGELMTIRAMKLGAVGAAVNGYSRDSKGILRLGFPTFSYGGYAQDQAPRGRVVDFRIPIEIAGVRVEPGDIVFGDVDGVCIVPRRLELDILAQAEEKVEKEGWVRKALGEGMSASDAFGRYRVM